MVDMVTLQVIMNGLQSITDEMNMALIRTAFSTNIKDRRDCSCAVYTAAREAIAQTELGCPVHLGIMPSALDAVFADMRIEDFEEGDHLIVNVPYPNGPGHLNDITMVSPVFVEGRAAFLVANMAHHVDVGGYGPGSMATGVWEIYQEGVQIPPLKIVKHGTLEPELMSLIATNVRTGAEIRGDIRAQIACNNVGIRRTKDLVDRYGVDTLQQYITAIFDYSERRTRAGLQALPAGVYRFEDYVEGTARTAELLKIQVAVTIAEDSIFFDFSGTDSQVDDSLNSNEACTRSACYYVVKALIDPGLPPNLGTYRPIRIHAPKGSIINANQPAAISNATIVTAPKVVDVLLGALLDTDRKRTAAASNGVTSLLNIGGKDPRTRRLYNYVETYAGGQGAVHNQDGMDAVQCHMTNTRNAPVEAIELAYPLQVHSYSLRQNSEGPGRFRGGLGMRREIEVRGENATLTVSTDRARLKPWGAFGGCPGANAACRIRHVNGETEQLPYSKMTGPVAQGDVVVIDTPGAGGWGNPLTRHPQEVLRDVIEQFITLKRAKARYGVVILEDADGHRVDARATQELRQSMLRNSAREC